MSQITTLAPHRLWHWFDVICGIPHASYKEEALATHIVEWAKGKGFTVFRDDVGNVFIKKPATDGMQDREPIALQAHLDMVCQSNDDYDFDTLPIVPVIDGEWVRASGTTLGADNGIGLASILAVLDSDDLAHPALEAVLTMTEETGMDGAFGLKQGVLDARLMINTDTEEIGEIYLGCAGGVDAEIALPIAFDNQDGLSALRLDIKGLKGGHSGIDIHKNHANAIKLLAYVLAKIEDVRLINIKGGTARNAIPRSAFAVVAVADKAQAIDAINKACQDLKTLIGEFETGFDWQISDDVLANCLDKTSTDKVINLINALPNGVYRNSDRVADTVETSSSLGVISLTDKVEMVSLIRSLSDVGKGTACVAVASTVKLAGGTVDFVGSYVGWEPNPSSPITALTADVYRQVIKGEPAMKVIHAGLECGLIQKAYPKMDIVSIGPTIKNAHSPDECVHIESVATYWQVLTGVLANSPSK